MTYAGEALIAARGIKKYFPITKGVFRRAVGEVRAVDDVDLDIAPGETFALVGESGSGKTTLGKVLTRVWAPTAGEILFLGRDIAGLGEDALKPFRRQMQVVHQDPTSSLNPKKRIKDIIEDPLIIHGAGDARFRQRRVRELLDLVELPPDFLYRYPNAVSGGQKQRVGIARALALNPKLVVLDEPTSALDVSVQAKIIALLRRLQRELNLTYLFITHDLSLVRNLATRVGVMYLGRLVEIGPTERLFSEPRHPYTRSLLSAIPVVSDEELAMIPEKVHPKGEIPSPANAPSGCTFHPRCYQRLDVCDRVRPDLLELGVGQGVRCHLYYEHHGGGEGFEDQGSGPGGHRDVE